MNYSKLITIPKTVKTIADNAFEGATIGSIKVPDGNLYNQAVRTKCFGARSYTSIQSY